MDQVFKIIEIMMNAGIQKSQVVSKQLVSGVRRIVIFILVSLGCMVLFCVGVSMALSDLALRIERPDLVGSILAIVSLAVFVYCLSQKAWMKTVAQNNENVKQGPSPIEEALALLITDFVVERQTKRQAPQEKETPNIDPIED